MNDIKTVLITGATGGLGRSIADDFYEKEFHLILTGTNDSKLDALRSKFDRNTKVIKCNLAKASEINNLSDKIKPSSIDILINNAGTLINKPFNETSFEDFQYVYKVNVFGVAELIRQLISRFKTKSHVVNISSIGGIGGSSKFPGLSAYSSSKGALNILTEMLAEEFKDKGISFNTLALGAVQTEMLEEAFPGYKANISSSEMANFIYKFSLEGNNFFNGKIIPVSNTNP